MLEYHFLLLLYVICALTAAIIIFGFSMTETVDGRVVSEVIFIYALHLSGGVIRYIGKSNNPWKRFGDHQYNARKGYTYPVYKWMRKYENKVNITVIDYALSEKEANELEIFWIAYEKSTHNTLLNMTAGGDGTLGLKKSPEEVEAMRQRSIGKPSAMKGKHYSEEQKAAIKLVRQVSKTPVSEYTRLKQSLAHRGKPLSSDMLNGKGGHITWHISRGILDLENCQHCRNYEEEQSKLPENERTPLVAKSEAIFGKSLIHGTPSGANEFGCKCEDCKGARRLYRTKVIPYSFGTTLDERVVDGEIIRDLLLENENEYIKEKLLDVMYRLDTMSGIVHTDSNKADIDRLMSNIQELITRKDNG